MIHDEGANTTQDQTPAFISQIFHCTLKIRFCFDIPLF